MDGTNERCLPLSAYVTATKMLGWGLSRVLRGKRVAILTILEAVAFAAATLVAAQTASAQPSNPSAAPCELHIWPAGTTHTTFQGWVRAGAVDGARRGIKGYPDLHADVLDTAEQARLLATVKWREAVGDPAVTVVIHSEPTGSDDDRTRSARIVTGASACYRELIITSSIIESEVFSSHSVRILALRKRFDGSDAAPVNFSSMSDAVVQLSDADKAAADAGERMNAAIKAAFVSAVNKFAVMQSFH